MIGRSLAQALLFAALVPLAPACGDDKDASTGTSSASASSSASDTAQTSGSEFSCEPGGGQCQCAGGCGPGSTPAPKLTCPQPPDSSGACSLECCVPDGSSSTGSTSASSSTASTTAGACVCADLPTCMTPEGSDCGGMYPTDQCCDEGGAPFYCSCVDPCTGGAICCSLFPGCA